ncbi:MAG: hypothetical protein WCC66_14595 [Rhizobiaceae bacterium]
MAESIYTKIDVDACQVVGKDEQGGRWACPGWGGYPVEFSEGDLRESLFFGHLGTWAKKSHWESFGQFNHVAGTVEWIVEGKVAKAAITRFIIQNSNADGEVDAALRGEVLVVYKVGQKGEGEACAVGYVDARANSNPNELARKVAATEVNGFACRFNEPGWHGIKGPTAGNASRSFEEMALE